MSFKTLKVLGGVVLLFCLYTSYFAVVDFYTGFHNLDLAQNFLRLGYDHDINLNGNYVSLTDFYSIGLNQMMKGFKWILFDVLLAFLIGFLWGYK